MVIPRTIRAMALRALLAISLPACDFEARGTAEEDADDPNALAPASATTEVTTPAKPKKVKGGAPPARPAPDGGAPDAHS